MPRFFFDFNDGERPILDQEGHEHVGTAEACDDARRALLEVAAERLQSEGRWTARCRIRSETEGFVHTIALAMDESSGSDAHAAWDASPRPNADLTH